MSSKAFASQADLVEKKVSFEQLSEHAWAYTAAGDPNTGIVIGDDAVRVPPVQIVLLPCEGLAGERYDAQPGTVYLLRPDQHVCARWRHPTAADVAAALKKALQWH